jgi:hypothetical protein
MRKYFPQSTLLQELAGLLDGSSRRVWAHALVGLGRQPGFFCLDVGLLDAPNDSRFTLARWSNHEWRFLLNESLADREKCGVTDRGSLEPFPAAWAP